MLKLDDLADDTELLFYIQVDWNILYGFVVLRDGEREIAREAQFDHLAEICSKAKLYEKYFSQKHSYDFIIRHSIFMANKA